MILILKGRLHASFGLRSETAVPAAPSQCSDATFSETEPVSSACASRRRRPPGGDNVPPRAHRADQLVLDPNHFPTTSKTMLLNSSPEVEARYHWRANQATRTHLGEAGHGVFSARPAACPWQPAFAYYIEPLQNNIVNALPEVAGYVSHDRGRLKQRSGDPGGHAQCARCAEALRSQRSTHPKSAIIWSRGRVPVSGTTPARRSL